MCTYNYVYVGHPHGIMCTFNYVCGSSPWDYVHLLEVAISLLSTHTKHIYLPKESQDCGKGRTTCPALEYL